MAEWIAGRTLAEVMNVFEHAEVAAAPVYDAEDLLADEHLQARGSFSRVEDPDLGRMTVQAPVARLSGRPARSSISGALSAPTPTRCYTPPGTGRRPAGRAACSRHHLTIIW